MIVARTADLESHLRQRLAKKQLLLMTHVVVGYPSFYAKLGDARGDGQSGGGAGRAPAAF
jgi:hypothetical protein